MTTARFARHLFTSSLVAAAWAASGVAVASPSSEAQARFRADMALCNSGQSNQDAGTCRIEARNALAEARRGGLTDAPGQYQTNAIQRCSALRSEDRSDCEARMRGEGSASGSAAAGGILRETVTTVPAK